MRRRKKIVDALSPLDAATDGLLKTILLLVAVGVVGVSFFGFTTPFVNDEICVVPNFGSSLDDRTTTRDDRVDFGLADDVELRGRDAEVCVTDPSARQHALAGLSEMPSFVVFVGFLVASRRIIARARREGVFARHVAQRVERVGWLIVLGLLVAAGVEWLADGILRTTMYDTGWASGSFHLSVVGLIGGYGIVAIGRVLARASDLQDDLEGTV